MTIELPSWAQVSDKRRAHIQRVATLLAQWADAMRISPDERRDWVDAARFHDALRDAPEMLHGPAAAERLAKDGEQRQNVLDAIRFHTVGAPTWDRTGRGLYMADFLEPGRTFSHEDRAFLSAQVP